MTKAILFLFLFSQSIFATDFLTFFSPEDNLINVITSTIAKAKKSVDVSIYSFDSTTVRDALEAKLDQGVKVRILIRPSTVARATAFVEPLKKKGAEVRYLTKTNHHKFIIVDNKWLLNSSGNFSDTKRAATYDENMFVCYQCHSYLSAFREEFRYLYRHATDLHQRESLESPIPEMPMGHLYDKVFMTSQNFEPFYKERSKRFHFEKANHGVGVVEEKLLAEIDKARNTIIVATGHLRSWNLYKALRRAAQRGVVVDMLLDSQEYVSKEKERYQIDKIKECKLRGESDAFCRSRGNYYSRKAMQSGINVYFKYYSFVWDFIISPQMHHKYMIIDDSKLLTGSYNWSVNAEFNSFENISLIEDYQVIGNYKQNFKTMLGYGAGGFNSLKSTLENAVDKLPMNFDPITLSMDQVDELYDIACAKCSKVLCRTDLPIDQLEDHEDDPDIKKYIIREDGINKCLIH